MIQAAGLRDRLPSALIALGLQAGLFALLALSFEIARQLPVEKETFLTLVAAGAPAGAHDDRRAQAQQGGALAAAAAAR